MWPFQRKAEAEPGRQSDTFSEPVPAPITRSDWKGLAPIQRAIGEHPLTARLESFAGELATHKDPSVVSRSLGHHVSPEAPAGLVLGVAVPTTRDDGPAMVPRPRVQRRANETVQSTPDEDTEIQSVEAAPVRGEIAGPTARRELPVVAAEPAVQRLTTVAPEMAPVPVGAGRQVAALSSIPGESGTHGDSMGPIGNESNDINEISAANVPARLTLGQSRRLGLGAPLRQVPSSSVQRAASTAPELTLASHHKAAESPSADVSSTFSSPGPEPVEQVSSRPAEPSHEIATASAPAAATVPPLGVQRAADKHELAMPALPNELVPGPRLDMPLAPAGQSGATSVQRATADDTPAADSSEAQGILPATMTEPAEHTAPPVPAATGEPADSPSPNALPPSISGPLHLVQRRAMAPTEAFSDAPFTSAEAATTSRPPLGLQRTPARADLSSRGELSGSGKTDAATPIAAPAPSMPVAQRASLAPVTTMGPRSSGAAQAPLALQTPLAPLVGSKQLATIQRATESAPSAVHEPIGRAFDLDLSGARIDRSDDAADASMSVQALAFTRGDAIALPAAHGSMQNGRGRSLLAHELTHVAQQRRYGSALPSESSPAGERLELQARAVEQQAARDMPLAPVASVASVQRATAIAESAAAVASAPSFSIQREPEAAPAPATSGSTSAPEAGTAATPSPGASPAHADQEQDMDELARKLYDRIRGRLKSELLVDRERAGLLTDLR